MQKYFVLRNFDGISTSSFRKQASFLWNICTEYKYSDALHTQMSFDLSSTNKIINIMVCKNSSANFTVSHSVETQKFLTRIFIWGLLFQSSIKNAENL